MRKVVELLVDDGRFLDVQPRFGTSLITALAHLGGRSVAIVANDPSSKAGAIDSPGAQKASRFLEVVGAFGLPVVFLADNPGVMGGTQAERSGVLRHVGRMFLAQHRLSGPKLHVTIRKAFGFGSSVMAMNPFDGQTLSLAFPRVTLGALPVASGAASAKLDDETRDRVAAEQAGASFNIARALGFDDVIDPRQLRNALLDGLSLSEGRAAPTP
jgi:acetyl-CoA carboxylase carboxyltransferase component